MSLKASISSRGMRPLALALLHMSVIVSLAWAQEARTEEGGPAPPKAPMDKAAIIKAQLPFYSVDLCMVSGEKLADMGDPVNYVHKGRLVRFCCKSCRKSFKKEPAKTLTKLDAAMDAGQKPT